MAIAKHRTLSIPSVRGVLDTALGLFARREHSAPRMPQPAVQSVGEAITPTAGDQSRYERLLEKELDRQHLTAVEREDTEMLGRVRAALYADD